MFIRIRECMKRQLLHHFDLRNIFLIHLQLERLAMPILKSFTFTAIPTASRDPVAIRRQKLVGRLEDQLALLSDPSFVRTVHRWSGTGDDRRRVEKQQPVRPWWRADAAGNVVFSVFHGTKPIEFEKGKAAIAVPSKDKLTAVVQTLIKATRDGELDELLSKSSKPVGKSKTRGS